MAELGSVVAGRYRLVSRIGEGGMGVVYEGVNLRIDRRVAIKVMHAEIARDEEAIARFEREAQAATAIGSEHVVDVLDLGVMESGERFIVMEYLEGENLSERFKRVGALDPNIAVNIASQVLDGLAKVHQAGILHRDLKPANIFLSTGGDGDFVKILDFGVCKVLQGRHDESITGVGQLLGTPAYMSPEQIERGPSKVDLRADVYSVGMILRRALAGVLPYKAPTLVALLVQMRAGKPPALHEVAPHVDPKLAAIVDRAIEWDPADRFRSALDFKGAIDHWRTTGVRVDKILSDFLELKPTDSAGAQSAPRSRAKPTAKSEAKRGDSLEDHSTTRRRTGGKPRKEVTDRIPGAPPLPEIPIDVDVDVELEIDLDEDAATIPLKPSRPRKTQR